MVDDPKGNLVELFPNVDHMEIPPEALCARDQAAEATAHVKGLFEQRLAELEQGDGVPLLMFERSRGAVVALPPRRRRPLHRR